MPESQPHGRLIVASNRIPVTLRHGEDGWSAEPSVGGLVTALAPVLRACGGVWVGWHGAVAEEGGAQISSLAGMLDVGFTLAPLALTAAQRDAFYLGFANETIWPLFHDLQARCTFAPAYWDAYRAVNHAFAAALAYHARPKDTIWVHDYHLMHVAHELRAGGAAAAVFFLHIPFPPPDIFLKLPWRAEVLRALLAYDRLGFQTRRDLRNFLQCVRTLLPDAALRSAPGGATVRLEGRTVHAGSYPIGIDARAFAGQASAPEVRARAEALRAAYAPGRIMLGVDRLDYTKGIVERLGAFRYALAHYPELHERLTFVQLVVPSRTDIPAYAELKAHIERLVSEINGQYSRPGWVPVHYLFRMLPLEELLAYYQAADIALITPLKDGMNLVAKEYAVCNRGDGALVLSEFAGAAAQLGRWALLVNPYDVVGCAVAIQRAFALEAQERRARIAAIRRVVAAQDVYWWVDTVLHGGETPPLRLVPPPTPRKPGVQAA
ncbi:MAG TPA: trehalose-6-phosphate synthase [Roseiflexaceae bacterium]|nr:trehalose-6-phosphate synthase [Roseiflexaceae bacterium]